MNWLRRSWFRHILSLRPFLYRTVLRRSVGAGVMVASLWDDNWHANLPLAVVVRVRRTSWFVGIRDSN